MTWVPRTSRESEVNWVSRETHALNLLPSLPFHSSILHSLSPLAFAVALTPKYCYSLSPLTSVLGVSMLPIPSGWPGENGAVRVWCWCWFKAQPPTESDQALTWQADLSRCQGSGSLVPTLELIDLFGEALQPLPSGHLSQGSGSSLAFALGLYGCWVSSQVLSDGLWLASGKLGSNSDSKSKLNIRSKRLSHFS